MRQVFFSLTKSPRSSAPFFAGVAYLYEGVTAHSIVVLSFYFFVFTFVVL